MRISKVLLIVILVVIAFALVACRADDLRTELSNANAEIEELRAELNAHVEFENSRTELEGAWVIARGDGQISILGLEGFGIPLDTPVYSITFSGNRFEVTEYSLLAGSTLSRLQRRHRDGRIRVFHPEGYVDGSEIHVAVGTLHWGGVGRLYIYSASGIFSITGDSIEFVYDDGTVLLASFRSTANTLTIGRPGNVDRDTSVFHRIQ